MLTSLNPPRSKTAPSIARIIARVTIAPITPATAFEMPPDPDPELLEEPRRTARPPYSKSGMHADPESALDTMYRTREFAKRENIWVIAAHDFSVGQKIRPGVKEIQGLVPIDDWQERNWKKPLYEKL